MRVRYLVAAAAAVLMLLPACTKRGPWPEVKPEPVEGGPPGALLVWPRPFASETGQLIDGAGLPRLPGRHDPTDVYHAHVHLEVWRGDTQVVVPALIGIGPNLEYASPLHTHEPSGVIHVESPVVQKFTLGQFFQLWKVPLDGAEAWVDDVQVADPAAIEFRDMMLVTVVF